MGPATISRGWFVNVLYFTSRRLVVVVVSNGDARELGPTSATTSLCVFVVKYEGREVRVGHAIVFFQRDFSLGKKRALPFCVSMSVMLAPARFHHTGFTAVSTTIDCRI